MHTKWSNFFSNKVKKFLFKNYSSQQKIFPPYSHAELKGVVGCWIGGFYYQILSLKFIFQLSCILSLSVYLFFHPSYHIFHYFIFASVNFFFRFFYFFFSLFVLTLFFSYFSLSLFVVFIFSLLYYFLSYCYV